jgi:hypothetical protein
MGVHFFKMEIVAFFCLTVSSYHNLLPWLKHEIFNLPWLNY